ncbi:hypothetical protein ACIBCD_41610 [Nocardia brasiliensis]|uniref:hypothetical protein n=1 Tax=Nocardia brasiliensis TaxID=37326 RepID=UPI0037B7C086
MLVKPSPGTDDEQGHRDDSEKQHNNDDDNSFRHRSFVALTRAAAAANRRGLAPQVGALRRNAIRDGYRRHGIIALLITIPSMTRE